MNIELRFRKEDLETENWVINELGVRKSDFLEIRPLDGTAILIAVFVAVEVFIKNPIIIDKFLRRDGCEVEFDEHGNLLKAKGYSASEVIKLIAIKKEKAKK